jgi:peptidoglycan/LPS O-acetylase OafA/YrhL
VDLSSEHVQFAYRPALDGLRGVAIALVVLFHAGLLSGGYIGVDVFFVLSGFLITSLLLEEHRSSGRINLEAFYVRRARRILPALLALLIVYAVVDEASGHNAVRTIALAGFFSANAVQAFISPNPLGFAGLAHLWSLAQEEQFYLVWPVLLVIARRRLLPVLVIAATAEFAYRTALAIDGASWERIYYGPDSHADGLLLGALLAVALARRPFVLREPLPVISFALLMVGAMLGPLTDLGWIVIWPFLLAGCVGMTAAAATETKMAELLAVKPFVGLGRISSSLYLWHVPVMIGLYDVTGHRHLLLALPISLTLAYLSYRFVEQPLRRRRGARMLRPAASLAVSP